MGLKAQKGLFAEAGFVDAFNSRTVQVDSEPIKNYQSYGYRAGLFLNYPVKKFDVRLGAGVKQLFFSGRYQTNNFTGNVSKFTANLSSLYRFGSSWKAGVAIDLENNRDFNEFRSKTSDLFRYNARVLVNYKISEQLFLNLDYCKALSPYEDYYLLTNPTDQITIGINYKLPWL